MQKHDWYTIENEENIDSPALLIYEDRVAQNIKAMIEIAGHPERLVPHVKTHKMREITNMQLKAGISRFKCATIAEAEMLAEAGASEVLLAYQPAGPKVQRLLDLIKKYPVVQFACLADNLQSAVLLNDQAEAQGLILHVYIDVNSGMNRTGIPANEGLVELHQQLAELKNLQLRGWHVYDGHIHDVSFEARKERIDDEFKKVESYADELAAAGFSKLEIIAGGTPAFTSHALRPEVSCSPGTVLLWDTRSEEMLPEQPFLYAAVLLTRIISKPAEGFITVDLGHKAVASENPLDKRVTFLNLKNYSVRSQSEEHLVLEVADWNNLQVGDVLYGVPYHVCPTVALYDTAHIIEDGRLITKWDVIARRRKISV